MAIKTLHTLISNILKEKVYFDLKELKFLDNDEYTLKIKVKRVNKVIIHIIVEENIITGINFKDYSINAQNKEIAIKLFDLIGIEAPIFGKDDEFYKR